MPQALNLSAIPEPVREDFQVQYPVRKKASKPSYSSSQLSASTTLAGKKVHKIATARKKSPDLEAGACCSSPLGVKRKPDNETAKPMGLKRKKKEKHLEEGQSSSLVPGAPGSSLAESEGLAAEIPSFKRRSAVEQMSPTGPVEEENKTLKSPGSARPSKLDERCAGGPGRPVPRCRGSSRPRGALRGRLGRRRRRRVSAERAGGGSGGRGAGREGPRSGRSPTRPPRRAATPPAGSRSRAGGRQRPQGRGSPGRASPPAP
ncbi:serine/arginine repetitive matrix protein 3-like [Phaenicophaeus curvirostris]|uniref:serine/arginine repetitive matrix protein 3-like n=1 Tax=Phaenicophaeus curvirostris TaxID=33595 RepID=UPI0037F0C81F